MRMNLRGKKMNHNNKPIIEGGLYMGKLKKKTAIVTGASSGIGSTIARRLAQEGAQVVLAARRKEHLDKVAKEINQMGRGKALPIQTDVSNKSDVEHMVRKAKATFGPIDIYVNNAGLMLDALVTNGKVD